MSTAEKDVANRHRIARRMRRLRARAEYWKRLYDRTYDELERWAPAKRVQRIVGVPGHMTDIPRRQGVYIIRGAGTGVYKIGFSRDMRSRINMLRLGSPVDTEVALLLVDAGELMEVELHKRFADSRIHGEWFRETPELVAFIEAGI